MNETRIATVGLIVVAIIAIWGLFAPTLDKNALVQEIAGQLSQALAGVTNYDQLSTTEGYQVDGTTVIDGNGDFALGTTINAIRTGSCTVWTGATTIAATTTQQVTCQAATTGGLTALTGVTTDSICTLNHATSTSGMTLVGGVGVFGVSASSTAGFVDAMLSNLTGATFTWTAAASSSPQWTYTCIDPT